MSHNRIRRYENFNLTLPTGEQIGDWASAGLVFDSIGENLSEVKNELQAIARQDNGIFSDDLQEAIDNLKEKSSVMTEIFSDDMNNKICEFIPQTCAGTINPIMGSSTNVCVNTVDSLKAGVCGELATSAQKYCLDSSICPHSWADDLYNSVMRRCNNTIPDGVTMCSWIPTVQMKAYEGCVSGLQNKVGCTEPFRIRTVRRRM